MSAGVLAAAFWKAGNDFVTLFGVLFLGEGEQPAHGGHPRLAEIGRCPHGGGPAARDVDFAVLKFRRHADLKDRRDPVLQWHRNLLDARRRPGAGGLELGIAASRLGGGALLVVGGCQVDDGAKPSRGLCRLVGGGERLGLAVERLPVARVLANERLGHFDDGLRLLVAQQAVDGPEDAPGLALASGHPGPDRLGLLELAVPGIKLGQPGRAVVAGGQLVELFLIPGSDFHVALFLGQF